MADKAKKSGPLEQHPLVSALRPDPAVPGPATKQLVGFPGDSDRPGYQRLYLSPNLDRFAEFAVADILYSTPVAADKAPLLGHDATSVILHRDAVVEFTSTRYGGDDFDIDARFQPLSQIQARLSTSLIIGNTSCFPTGCETGPDRPTLQ